MSDPRVTFTVDQSLKQRLSKIPWGLRSEIARMLLTRVLDEADKKGGGVYSAICAGQFNIKYEVNDGS